MLKIKNKKKILAIASIIAIVAVIGASFAFAFASSTGDDGKAIKEIVSKFASYVVDMFRVVGILISIYAVAQFALAFKDDNPEAKSRSTILLVIGLLLLLVKSLASLIISTAGISGISLDNGFLGK